MEPVLKQSGTSKGLEVLFFPDAEVRRIKGGQPLYAATGPLSVLYFKDFNRFFLRINDWLYPLTRRLPMVGSDKSGSSHTYTLPGPNGSNFELRIDSHGSPVGLENFESIVQESSTFNWRGQPHTGKLEQSPDDKLTRTQKKESGVKEVITEAIKHGVHAVKTKVETLKTGTANINSRKKMMNIKTIRNKNWKKNAKSSFKKDFFQAGEKAAQQFLKLRSSNLNMILPRTMQEMMKTSDTEAPSLFIPKEELEDAILNYRDLATSGKFSLGDVATTVTQGVRDIKDTLSGRREEPAGQTINKTPVYEGMTHYQG